MPSADPPSDALEIAELGRARVQILLSRYGLLFRELLGHESQGYRWRDVFPHLRRMELSGEVLAGRFFKEIPGPQFILPEALHLLTQGLPRDYIYWVCTQDPISPCRIDIKRIRTQLPTRADGNHLVFHDAACVVISRQNGRRLQVNVAADHPDLMRYFNFMNHLLERPFQPLKRITIETINGQHGTKSPYYPIFEQMFEVVRDHRRITLYRTQI